MPWIFFEPHDASWRILENAGNNILMIRGYPSQCTPSWYALSNVYYLYYFNQRFAQDFNANILQDTEKPLVTDEVLQKFPEIHVFFFITRRLNSLQGRFDKARSRS